MTDETTRPVLEISKKNQGDMRVVRDDIEGIRGETGAMKQHIAAFMPHEINQDNDIASIKARLERIERRLDPGHQ